MKPRHINLALAFILTFDSSLCAGFGRWPFAIIAGLLAILNFLVYLGRRAADVDKT